MNKKIYGIIKINSQHLWLGGFYGKYKFGGNNKEEAEKLCLWFINTYTPYYDYQVKLHSQHCKLNNKDNMCCEPSDVPYDFEPNKKEIEELIKGLELL